MIDYTKEEEVNMVTDDKMGGVLNRSNGANFHLADLHIHTPIDKQFRCLENTNFDLTANCQRYAEKYIKEAREKGLKVIGITEHNDISWIDYIRRAAEDEKDKNGNPITQDDRIVVFPGVEVCSKEGIHTLVLFNPSEDVTIIDGFLSEIGLTPQKRLTPSKDILLAQLDFEEILSKVAGRYRDKAICIPPHIESDKGLFRAGAKKELFLNRNLLVVESKKRLEDLGEGVKSIIKGEDPNYGRKAVAFINGSDARSLDEIGTKCSYIKMSSLMVEGLRQAFLDWKSRIRLKEELDEKEHSRIIAARWKGGNCFLDGMSVHFNPNLNAIIGGKGTGKSTVIETLRYAFDQETKSANAKKQYEDIRKEVFRSGSILQVLVYSSDLRKHYLIERSYPGEPVVKSIHEDDFKERGIVREDEILDLPLERVLSPEIYGQKEIADISEDQAFQLKLIDRLLGEEFEYLQSQQRGLLTRSKVNKRDIIATIETLEKLEESNKQLVEIKQKKKKFIELGIQEKLRIQTSYDREKLLIEKAISRVGSLKEHLAEFFDTADTDVSFLSDRLIEDLSNSDLLRESRETLKTLFDFLHEKRAEIEASIFQAENKFMDEKGIKERWDNLYETQQGEYQRILQELHRAGVPLDPNEFRELERRENFLMSVVGDKERYDKQGRDLEKTRKKLLDELKEVRLEQFRARQSVAQNISERLKGILKVEVEYASLRDEFVDKLVSYSSRENRIMREPIKNMVNNDGFDIGLFVNTLRKGEQALIEKLGLTPGTAGNLYRAIPREDYYDIETLCFDPKTLIKLYIGPPGLPAAERSDNLFKGTDHLSKGQKCTAILTLVLLESNRPLIIDQPEDDLDNRFVVDDVVEKLREEKEKRQFIVATHNANITVSADAELILALDADEKRGKEEASGSIDDLNIREAVERILEGGRSAFIMRKEKYGF